MGDEPKFTEKPGKVVVLKLEIPRRYTSSALTLRHWSQPWPAAPSQVPEAQAGVPQATPVL
jgi:hypothetical protein